MTDAEWLEYIKAGDAAGWRAIWERVVEPESRSLRSAELMKRYYYQRGSIIEQLKEDKDLEAAVGVLTDKARYEEILSSPNS